MSTRRDALRTLAAAAAFPLLNAQQHGTSEFFTADDLGLLSKLVDVIIPRTDTPGASDAGVPLYIDSIASRKPATGEALLKGLAQLREAGFDRATPEERAVTLTNLSDSSDRFFQLVKELTVDGFYSSRQGLVTELGYHGNTFLSEFPGCTHPEHR